jgi:hypothetical protein
VTKGTEKPEKLELLDPKNDFLFKKLFAAPGNEDLLIDLLNSILKLKEEKKICQVIILNPIKTRDHLKDKEVIMDILARTGEGTLITIEIQVADEHDMQKEQLITGALFLPLKCSLECNTPSCEKQSASTSSTIISSNRQKNIIQCFTCGKKQKTSNLPM